MRARSTPVVKRAAAFETGIRSKSMNIRATSWEWEAIHERKMKLDKSFPRQGRGSEEVNPYAIDMNTA